MSKRKRPVVSDSDTDSDTENDHEEDIDPIQEAIDTLNTHNELAQVTAEVPQANVGRPVKVIDEQTIEAIYREYARGVKLKAIPHAINRPDLSAYLINKALTLARARYE